MDTTQDQDEEATLHRLRQRLELQVRIMQMAHDLHARSFQLITEFISPTRSPEAEQRMRTIAFFRTCPPGSTDISQEVLFLQRHEITLMPEQRAVIQDIHSRTKELRGLLMTFEHNAQSAQNNTDRSVWSRFWWRSLYNKFRTMLQRSSTLEQEIDTLEESAVRNLYGNAVHLTPPPDMEYVRQKLDSLFLEAMKIERDFQPLLAAVKST